VACPCNKAPPASALISHENNAAISTRRVITHYRPDLWDAQILEGTMAISLCARHHHPFDGGVLSGDMTACRHLDDQSTAINSALKDRCRPSRDRLQTGAPSIKPLRPPRRWPAIEKALIPSPEFRKNIAQRSWNRNILRAV
jgi:hypothetical protein